MRYFDRERELQKKEADTDMTWIDAFFFSVVTTTTVGYGHIISAHSDGAKWFFTLYFLLSTTATGKIIGDLSALYYNQVLYEIRSKIIDSTVYVHTSDLGGVTEGHLAQSDYVLFKLQQMQAVDVDMLHRLCNRFHQLDEDRTGFLTIGKNIPSAQQVKEMQKDVDEGRFKTLTDAWVYMKPKVPSVHALETPVRPKKVTDCSDFAWSRSLFKEKASALTNTVLKMTFVYFALGYLTMASLDPSIANGNWGSDKGWYFISATISTVGLGDFAPETQLTRGFAIVMMPFGIVILSQFIGAIKMTQASNEPVVKPDTNSAVLIEAKRIFDALGVDGSKSLSRNEFKSGAEQAGMTVAEATKLFDELDTNKNGMIEWNEIAARERGSWQDTTWGRFAIIIFKVYLTIFVGALFFMTFTHEVDELDLSWINALYLGTVISTSVGYGDIVPRTYGGRLFLTFYFIAATVIIGTALGDLIDLYINGIVGEDITRQIIASTTWVHKADITDPAWAKHGKISEADYCVFKLLQLQKVDEDVLAELIDRFFELDGLNSGTLVIGTEVPSAAQVVQLKGIVEGTAMTTMQAWERHLSGAIKLRNGSTLARVSPEDAEFIGGFDSSSSVSFASPPLDSPNSALLGAPNKKVEESAAPRSIGEGTSLDENADESIGKGPRLNGAHVAAFTSKAPQSSTVSPTDPSRSESPEFIDFADAFGLGSFGNAVNIEMPKINIPFLGTRM